MVKPVPFDPAKKYPVILAIYGGPGSQQVYDQFASSGWAQWLAQQGYIVVGLNNRGTNNYGSAFVKVVYKHLGNSESPAFPHAALYIGAQPDLNPARLTIMG